VQLLSGACRGRPNTHRGPTAAHSRGVAAVLALLATLEGWIGLFPPVASPTRFGNAAFRAWRGHLATHAHALVRGLPPPAARVGASAAASVGASGGGNGIPSGGSSGSGEDWSAVLGNAEDELAPYLIGSFGDATRIDYGTGHETSFLAFLYGLAKVNDSGDEVAAVKWWW